MSTAALSLRSSLAACCRLNLRAATSQEHRNTIGSRRPMTSSSQAKDFKMHQVARSGFDNSGASGLYDHPDEVVDKILAAPGRDAIKVVELGPGTGISTRALLSRAPSSSPTPVTVERYRGFEPSSGMRSHFTKSVLDDLVPKLKERAPAQLTGGATVADGVFDLFAEAAGKGENDLVLIAQAWHWCPDFDAALREIASSLRKGGVLALLWNLEDRDAAKWVAMARDCFEAYEGDAPQYRQMKWKAMYDTAAFKELYTALPEVHVTRALPTTLEAFHERVISKSYISVLPPDQQEMVKRDLTAIFRNRDEDVQRKWIDKEKGIFEYPYQTNLYMFVKK